MSIEALAAIGAFLGVAYGLYERYQASKKKNRADMIVELENEVERKDKAIALRDKRCARLERDVDRREIIILRQRDYIGLLKLHLYKNNIEIPESRRKGDTKTIDEMVDELGNGHEPHEPDEE